MEFLRYIFFIPSAVAGGALSMSVVIFILMLMRRINDFAGYEFNLGSPIILVIEAFAFTYAWFVTGMYVSPKKHDPKIILFTLTVILAFFAGVLWAPLFYRFNQSDFLAGKYSRFIYTLAGIVGTSAWVWLNNDTKNAIMRLHKHRETNAPVQGEN